MKPKETGEVIVKLAFRGIANHAEGDFLHVCWWIGAKNGLFAPGVKGASGEWECKMLSGTFGGIFGLPEVLPKELKVGKLCAQWDQPCGTGVVQDDSGVRVYGTAPKEKCQFNQDGVCKPPRFRFDAEVEIEILGD